MYSQWKNLNFQLHYIHSNLQFFHYIIEECPKIGQGLWVLSPTLLKSMGAEARTAPIITWTSKFRVSRGCKELDAQNLIASNSIKFYPIFKILFSPESLCTQLHQTLAPSASVFGRRPKFLPHSASASVSAKKITFGRPLITYTAIKVPVFHAVVATISTIKLTFCIIIFIITISIFNPTVNTTRIWRRSCCCRWWRRRRSCCSSLKLDGFY